MALEVTATARTTMAVAVATTPGATFVLPRALDVTRRCGALEFAGRSLETDAALVLAGRLVVVPAARQDDEPRERTQEPGTEPASVKPVTTQASNAAWTSAITALARCRPSSMMSRRKRDSESPLLEAARGAGRGVLVEAGRPFEEEVERML